jgi:hypothetical protein
MVGILRMALEICGYKRYTRCDALYISGPVTGGLITGGNSKDEKTI